MIAARDLRGGFALRLAVIVAAGLAVRLYYALAVMGDFRPAIGDGLEFHDVANTLAEGHGFIQTGPFLFEGGLEVPWADKPPLYPSYLALSSLLGGSSFGAHRAASCLLGAVTVLLVGLLARRVAGDRAGLLAAAIAAVYPMLVVLDGALRSESLYVLLTAGSMLAAYRLLDRPTAGCAALLGALVGLAALTRSEAMLLVPLLVLPLAWRAGQEGRRRLRLALAAGAACALVVTPWVVRNALTFERPVAISTNEGGLLYGANCDLAYSGPLMGHWPCFPEYPPGVRDESELSWRFRRQALDYIRDHSDRLPAVVAVRVLRSWELWHPRKQAFLEARVADRNIRWQQAGVAAFYALALLAVVGAAVLRRRGTALLPLLAAPALVTLVSALTYGSTRFRAAAEISLVVLAAVAITHLAGLAGSRRSQAPPPAPAAGPR